jgi:hypothetical protein
MKEHSPNEAPIESPPADQEPAALAGRDLIPGADGADSGAHACQPPREAPPPAGSEWACPACGRIWHLKDITARGEGGPGQTVSWEAAT